MTHAPKNSAVILCRCGSGPCYACSAVEVWVVQMEESEILVNEAMSILPLAGNQ